MVIVHPVTVLLRSKESAVEIRRGVVAESNIWVTSYGVLGQRSVSWRLRRRCYGRWTIQKMQYYSKL